MADESIAARRFDRLEPSLRERILGTAAEEFSRFGYRVTSMNRVVERAGISKGALFKYFGTKAGLFKRVYTMALDEVRETLRRVREETHGDPFFSRLERVLTAGLEFTDRRPVYAAIYYRVIYTGDSPHGKEILRGIQAESQRFLRSLIEDGIARGDLRRDLDPEKAAFILQGVLDRFLQARHLEFMAPDLRPRAGANSGEDEWIREIVNLFRRGMENHE